MNFPKPSNPSNPSAPTQRPTPTGVLSTPFGNLVLANLEGDDTIVFQYFPSSIDSEARANWQSQDVSVGMKPLFYENREPRQVKIDDLWLDKTGINDSITPDIKALYALMEVLQKKGRPPVLLLAWGDQQQRCVLESVSISDVYAMGDGTPMRARVSITLIEFKDEPMPQDGLRPRRVSVDFSRPRRVGN